MARVFLRIPELSQHPACMDHGIPHEEPFSNPLIQPHFDYYSQDWVCLGKVLSDKLQRLQHIRIIIREGYETRSKDILSKGFARRKTDSHNKNESPTHNFQ